MKSRAGRLQVGPILSTPLDFTLPRLQSVLGFPFTFEQWPAPIAELVRAKIELPPLISVTARLPYYWFHMVPVMFPAVSRTSRNSFATTQLQAAKKKPRKLICLRGFRCFPEIKMVGAVRFELTTF
jgi:hypothetical protein